MCEKSVSMGWFASSLVFWVLVSNFSVCIPHGSQRLISSVLSVKISGVAGRQDPSSLQKRREHPLSRQNLSELLYFSSFKALDFSSFEGFGHRSVFLMLLVHGKLQGCC